MTSSLRQVSWRAEVPQGFASRWRTVRGLRLHALEFVDSGAPACPAVLLPGLVTASRSMVPLARALARHGMRIWILDPPGFGYSDKPRRALAMAEQAGIVADWLVAIDCRPARPLGNSFGSQVAAALAADHPAAVARLVLLAPTVGPVWRRRRWLRALPGPTGSRHRPSSRWRAHLLTRLHDVLGDDPPLRMLNVVEYGCASLPRALSTVRCAVLEATELALPRVSVPTLVIRADLDHLSSLDWAERLADLVPNGRFARLPGQGHAAFYRAAETVAAVAGPFLAADPPGAGPC